MENTGNDKNGSRAPGEAIIFLHVPKTAGTTLNRLIEWEYPISQMYSVDPVLFEWSAKHLWKLPKQRLAKTRMFKGHMLFGLHEVLPQPSTYITVLRNPVERVLSLFRFLKSMPANAIAHLRLDPNFGLEELLQSRVPENYAQTHNLMCRMLCGDPALMDDSASVFWTPETAPESIQRSLINLDNMDFGLVEHMSSTLALLEDAYGLDFRLQEHFINTTVKSRGEGNLDIVHKIVQQNAADIVLYREASRIFHARVKGLATLTQRLNAPSHEYLAYRSRGD